MGSAGMQIATRLSVALLLLAASCVGSDDSCGGPTSDLPFCGGDDDRSPDDGEGSGEPGTSNPPPAGEPEAPSDAGASSGADDDGADDAAAGDAGVCSPVEPVKCMGASSEITAAGQSPVGPVAVSSLAISYLTGMLPGTRLSFDATISGQPGRLEANLLFAAGASPVAPAGTYLALPGGPSEVQVSLSGCGLAAPSLAARIEIYEHDRVALDGTSGVLRGALVITEPGWDLTIPFETHQACLEVSQP